jgi:hypothetical protein
VIVPADLLAGLQRLLKRLEADIRIRCETNDEIDAPLRAEYEKAKSASRTAGFASASKCGWKGKWKGCSLVSRL